MSIKHWKPSELATLQRLRERFLTGAAGNADYWSAESDLALYDATFAERIGWKWDAVFRELTLRGWQPKSRNVVDWGCGSGVAGRRVLSCWPQLESLALHDRSPLAIRFAADKARIQFPKVRVAKFDGARPADSLIVLSHIINELSSEGYSRLLSVLRHSREIVWVEAGTHADSRRLIEVREELGRDFTPIAPCTHRAACGMLAPENAPHWCHHIAEPPPAAFQDARWAEWGREMSIDLRRLPYSFLVLERAGASGPAGYSRVIGEPRESKGYLRVLSCQESGVADLMLQKRDSASLFRELRKGFEAPIYRWEMKDGKIVSGEGLRDSGEEPGTSH